MAIPFRWHRLMMLREYGAPCMKKAVPADKYDLRPLSMDMLYLSHVND